MIKFSLRLDKDKETQWLNEMSKKGYSLTGFFAGFYKFEKCNPGEYVYQIDMTEGLFSVTDDYRTFMQEAGIEIVCCWGFWVILRKKASEGKFALYTDVESTLEHYKKIRKLFKVVTIIELLCFYVEVFAAIQGALAGYAGMCIIGLLLFGLVNILIKTNKRIGELQERLGQENNFRRRPANIVLASGLLLNGCIQLTKEYLPEPAFIGMSIVAIILMLAGIYQTCASRYEP